MKTHKNVTIRMIPEGYKADCFIVTGSIYFSEVRIYRTINGALKYANALAKDIECYGCQVTVEERLYDPCSRLAIIEE